MAQITTRITSGGGATVNNAPLSNTQIDNNFINLNTDKIEQNDAVSENTADKVVRRDSSGGFSAGQVSVSSVKTGDVTYPTLNATTTEVDQATETSTRFMSPALLRHAAETVGLRANASVTKDLTGFENRSTSTLSFNPITRVLSLTPLGTCNVYHLGKKITISSTITYTFPDSSIGRYIAFDPDTGQLYDAGDVPSFTGGIIYVSYIHYDADLNRPIIVADERHQASRDTQWHYTQHRNVGAVWRSGGSASYTLSNQNSVTLGINGPIIVADEDLEHTISHNPSPTGYYNQILTTAASIPTLYLNGSVYTTTADSTLPWIAGNTTARYNQIVGSIGQLVDAGEGKYITYWIVATNDMLLPIKAIMGRVAHSDIQSAYAEVFEDYGLPFAEIAPMYQVVLQTSASYVGNAARVVISAVRMITNNQVTATSAFSASSHSGLSNLTNDDHLQYLHLTNARVSTADHTFNGKIVFGSTSNIRLPRGTTAERPASPSVGDIRFNTTINTTEIYNGTTWGGAGGAQQGTFYQNDKVVSINYTVPSNQNAMTAGPITINDGVTVTVSDGATWTII